MCVCVCVKNVNTLSIPHDVMIMSFWITCTFSYCSMCLSSSTMGPVKQWILLYKLKQYQLLAGCLLGCESTVSFPGSLNLECEHWDYPGMESLVFFPHDHDVIEIGTEFLEQKGNILLVVQPTMCSPLSMYDICPMITK